MKNNDFPIEIEIILHILQFMTLPKQ